VGVWLAASVAGTIAGLAAWLVWWFVRDRRERRRERDSIRAEAAATGVSLAVPVARPPADVRGRVELVRRLGRQLSSGGLVVLAGMGGVGKSTVAAEMARRARRPRLLRRPAARQVWWVSGATATSLTQGLAAVARRLGASAPDLAAIDGRAADAPDRLWTLLDAERRRWLLVIDDACDPDLLAAPDRADRAGWVRASARGLVLVTTRHAEQAAWGTQAAVHRLEPLGDGDAGDVLRDLAPEAGGQPEAEALGRQLGGLPLALRLAGLTIAAGYGRWATFDAYRDALDRVPVPTRLLDADSDVELDRGRRAVVMRSAELSLVALADHGLPESRALLRLLSCYAPWQPIPVELLRRAALSPLPHHELHDGRGAADVLRALARLGLVDEVPDQAAVTVHPVLADAGRAHLGSPTIARDPDPDFVRDTAVVPLLRMLRKLDAANQADWPGYRRLAPHLLALLRTTGRHLSEDRLASLLVAACAVADAYDRAGAAAASTNVLSAALELSDRLRANHPTILLLRDHLPDHPGTR
jgi:NB-ARC domain